MSFQAVLFVFMFFPVAPNPDVPNFNWTTLVFGVVVIWAIGYYHLWGKKKVCRTSCICQKAEYVMRSLGRTDPCFGCVRRAAQSARFEELRGRTASYGRAVAGAALDVG